MSKVTLKTDLLKEAMTKAIKGSGRLPMLQITMSIGVEIKNGDLILTTTDNVTNLKVTIKKVGSETDNFYVCTDSDLFYKLVSKTTTPEICLELTDTSLLFKGNGAYNLPIISDVEGEGAVRIKTIDVAEANGITIAKEDLEKFVQYNKLSVAKSFETPYLTGFCVDSSKVITYNNNTACVSTIKWNNSKVLLPSTIVNLFDTISEKEVTLYSEDTKIKFVTPTIEISGTLLEGLDEYPANELCGLVNDETFKNVIKIDKAALVSALDRLSLFVNPEERNTIDIAISDKALIITSKDQSGCEAINFLDGNVSDTLDRLADINDVKTIVSSLKEDFVTIKFGHPIGLLITESGSNQIIPFVNQEASEE